MPCKSVFLLQIKYIENLNYYRKSFVVMSPKIAIVNTRKQEYAVEAYTSASWVWNDF